MLELISKDVPIGSKIKLYLITGDTIEGILAEVGSNFIVVNDNGARKRFFEQMIGGWDIIDNQSHSEKKALMHPVNKTDLEDQSESQDHLKPFVKRFRDSLSDDESSFIFAPNAKIISADKKNVVIRTNDDNSSFYVPYKFIASKGVLSDIESLLLSGEDSQSTSIPVYVGFNSKDKDHIYPNIVLEPGTMLEYCRLLSELTQPSSSQGFLAKNLAFILWKGCTSKKSREELKALQSAFNRGTGEKDFLSEINEQIRNTSEKGKDINPLLTRKAQWLSSQNRYEEAVEAYITLIDSLKSNVGASPQSISHNYTQLALLQIRLGNLDGARESIREALQFNPNNTYAQDALNKLDSPGGNSSSEIMYSSSPLKMIQIYTDSVLQDDMTQHDFSDPEAMTSNGSLSISIAERLLSQAESEDSLTAYLEAAKAYYSCEIKDDGDEVTKYAKAMFGYTNLKAYSSYNLLVNKNTSLNQKDLLKTIDGSYCYFVSAINFSSLIGHNWAALFRDYLRLRVLFYAKQKQFEDISSIFELPIDEYIKAHQLEKDIDFLLVCSSVLLSLGTRCPVIRISLHDDTSKSVSTILSLLDSVQDKNLICKQLSVSHKCSHIKYTGSIENLFAEFIDYRVKKLSSFETAAKTFHNKSTDSLLEAKTLASFRRLRTASTWLFTQTETEFFLEAENNLKALAVFKGRSAEERQILLPSIKAHLSDNVEAISNYSSYLCSALIRSLWSRLLGSKYLSTKDASSALLSELVATSDGNIILNQKGEQVIPISISNAGRSTIDKFKVTVVFSELENDRFEYSGKRLASGEASTLQVSIPTSIQDHSVYDYSVELSGLILNNWSPGQFFNLTASRAENVTYKLSDIKWDFQAKETRIDMFKGRNTDIERLMDTFTSTDRRKIPVVFGLTRTGKSSILLNLQKKLEKQVTTINGQNMTIVPVYIDLSALKSQYQDHDSFMQQLRLLCDKALEKVGWNLQRYKVDSLIELITYANRRRLYPIFMFDEFSWVTEVIKVEGNEFLKSIREYAIEEKAGFIYAGTYDILDIIRDPVLNPSGAFMNIDEYKIYNIKDPKDAEALMRVMEPKLVFTDPAIKAIHDYSGDVPYWIQMICNFCARYGFANNRPVIGMKELEDVIKGILGEATCNGVNKVSDILIEQQQILSSDPKEIKALLFSIAYLMNDKSNKDGVSWSRLKEFWRESSYNPNMESIILAKERLEDRLGLLSQEVDGNRIYRFSVGLFRRWCARKDVFSEFDRTNN